MNRLIVVGRLGQDPKVFGAGEKPVVRFSVAQKGRKGAETMWHNCVAFGKTAELAQQYLKKGSQVLVEGELKENSFKDKDGVEKKTVEVIANQVHFLSAVEGGTRIATSEEKATVSKRSPEVPF